MTIFNSIDSFSFTNSPYVIGESNGTVILQIVRNGPAGSAASVNYNTYTFPNTTEAEGDAQPNVDYVPASGTLTFGPNETFTTIPITILQGNVPNGPLTFQVQLSGANPANFQIGPVGTAFVTIEGDVTAFQFVTNSYAIGENGTNIVLTVQRLNPDAGAASVQYATSDGSAQSNVDYISTSGTLNFQDFQSSATISVPILNLNMVENNKSFTVALSNPKVTTPASASTNAYLLSPSNATVTITNVLAGVSFTSPAYSVSECGGVATIPVMLTGATNYPVTVTCATTTGGSAVPGMNGNYLTNSETLVFSNGQTVQDMTVDVINNHIIGPNHTVFLALSSPSPQASVQLLNPSTAVLTIQECNGAYIVSSGTAFVSGSVPNSGGVLSPNETVTLLFGLRDMAGSNTTHLVATLQATNGVTNITAGTNTYGVLVTGGATVAEPFTFKVVGTNGQNISANLALTDGTNVYPNVDFGLTIGGSTATFSNNETLFLVGSNNPPSKASSTNTPYHGYPSVINVSGVVGAVTGVTAGINNFGHTYPSDVAVVLESPSGLDSFLMEDCGGSVSVQHINLNFSQSLGNPSLPASSALTSGTFLPTAYGDMQPLPVNNGGLPAPAASLPDQPEHLYWTATQWKLVALCRR